MCIEYSALSLVGGGVLFILEYFFHRDGNTDIEVNIFLRSPAGNAHK